MSIELSLYVHLPWCVRRCPYCDFNAHTAGDRPPKARYLDALERDLELAAADASGRELHSVFLGGGTPSLFSPAEIDRLLSAVERSLGLPAGIEITMEANPGTVEFGDPAGYRTAGVNRLSIGAQSFHAPTLKTLGRIHGVEDIHRAVAQAQAAGLDNINIDLMHSLPGQTAELAAADLGSAVELGVPHISWYQLTLEPNTVFHARPPADLPDEATCDAIVAAGSELLGGAGYANYEVSAWCQPGQPSRHNLNYWRFGDYLAVGAGAHGKLTFGSDIVRTLRPANPLGYMQAVEAGETASRTPVEPGDRLFEFMLNASRLAEPFTAEQICERTALPRAGFAALLNARVSEGLLLAAGEDAWRVSALGARFLNDLQAGFLPSDAQSSRP